MSNNLYLLGRMPLECRYCKSGHGDLVCDCGCRHDEHILMGPCKYHNDCERYSQWRLNNHPGVDARKQG